ncbi:MULTISPECIES: transposase [unclassified Carboxylicivirga]|uniref:transposase n=1 Tax=Carboxylicivirga TaxID=1628153 RepID=UPI003D32EF51
MLEISLEHTYLDENYFNGRSTNAAAESFNAKIKDFRRQFRGVKDVNFFLYRLCKIYA